MKNFQLDPTEFQKQIKDATDLCQMAKKFPDRADELIEYVLKTPDEFERLIHGASLCDIAIAFPKYADVLIERVLETDEEYERVIERSDIGETIDTFPRYADALILRMVTTPQRLNAVATRHPQYADALLEHVIETPEKFRMLIKTTHELYWTAKAYPNYADRLANKIFEQPDKYPISIENSYDFGVIVTRFPHSQYVHTLIKKTLENPVEFNKFMLGRSNVCTVAIAFPQYTNMLIQGITESFEKFEKFAKDTSVDLSTVFKAFPQYTDEFSKPTIEEVFKAVKQKELYLQSKAEIVEKSRVIAQGHRTPYNQASPCLFRAIPKELQAHIAGYTGKHGAHNEQEDFEKPDDIAFQNLNKPK